MPSRYAWADLAISRSGALTIAELAMAGLPAVLIPYPFAADDHQSANAEELSGEGAALVVDSKQLDVSQLGEAILRLISEPGELASMSRAAGALARPEAAHCIVDECVALIEESKA